ncbi:MAG: Rep family protein [Micrococcaceae bacterium]
MARKENAPILVELVQAINLEYWAFSNDSEFVRLHDTAHAAADLPKEDPDRVAQLRRAAHDLVSYIVQRLEFNSNGVLTGIEVEHAHGILHSDDVRDVWDELTKDWARVPKELHLHLVIKLRSREKSAPIPKLAGLAGVEPQYIEQPGRGGGAVDICGTRISVPHDNMLAYLIHAKYQDKAQYPPEQVATVRGIDYMDVYRVRIDKWIDGRVFIKKKRVAESFEVLLDKARMGEITEAQVQLTDELFEVYAEHSREFDLAFEVAGKRRAHLAAYKLRNGHFKTQVVYIHGPAGSGKTRFASRAIEYLQGMAREAGENWTLYRAATGNPLDDWQGQEIILLDDLRANAMSANEWLLLLDPHNASPARARYRNKSEVAPRLIVITSTIEPVEFFYYARNKGEVDEAIDQFIRRLLSIVQVLREGDYAWYLVQQVGHVGPYVWPIEHQGTNGLGVPAVASTPVDLSYAALEGPVHSHDGAVGALAVGIASGSSDLKFDETEAWRTAAQRVQEEQDQHTARYIGGPSPQCVSPGLGYASPPRVLPGIQQAAPVLEAASLTPEAAAAAERASAQELVAAIRAGTAHVPPATGRVS